MLHHQIGPSNVANDREMEEKCIQYNSKHQKMWENKTDQYIREYNVQ